MPGTLTIWYRIIRSWSAPHNEDIYNLLQLTSQSHFKREPCLELQPHYNLHFCNFFQNPSHAFVVWKVTISKFAFTERQQFTRLCLSCSKEDAKKFVALAKKINSEKICLQVSKVEYFQLQPFKCCVSRSGDFCQTGCNISGIIFPCFFFHWYTRVKFLQQWYLIVNQIMFQHLMVIHCLKNLVFVFIFKLQA